MALGLAARLRSNAMERSDKVLLATFLLAATLGTWTRCLLVNDGAVYITAAWIGNTWPLFFDQNVGRTVSTLMQFGLAWALRPAFGGSSDAFVVAAHVFYFAGPLVLWLILRAVEPHRVYSQLYLAVTVMMIFFTSEMIVGMGVWLIWLAFLASPRSGTAKIVASAAAAPVLAFTHPAIALLSLLFALIGGVLMLRRAFPRPPAIAAGAVVTLASRARGDRGDRLRRHRPRRGRSRIADLPLRAAHRVARPCGCACPGARCARRLAGRGAAPAALLQRDRGRGGAVLQRRSLPVWPLRRQPSAARSRRCR